MGHGTGAACVHFLMTSEALPLGKYIILYFYLKFQGESMYRLNLP